MTLRGSQTLIHPLGAMLGWIVLAVSLGVFGPPLGLAGWAWFGGSFAAFWLVWFFVLPHVRLRHSI